MIIDCIADLHGFYPELEGGDFLVIAGDLTARDEEKEYFDFSSWCSNLKYDCIIVIAGNHDRFIEKKTDLWRNLLPLKVRYLCDSGTEYNGLKIWGSPWTPLFKGVNPKCKVFMLPDDALFDKWEMIPKGIDILITHGPAFGTLDYRELEDGTRWHMGSQSLESWIKYVERPQYHIFGHIHEAYGIAEEYPTYNDKMMQSINCSHVNEKYKPVNKPIRIEI